MAFLSYGHTPVSSKGIFFEGGITRLFNLLGWKELTLRLVLWSVSCDSVSLIFSCLFCNWTPRLLLLPQRNDPMYMVFFLFCRIVPCIFDCFVASYIAFLIVLSHRTLHTWAKPVSCYNSFTEQTCKFASKSIVDTLSFLFQSVPGAGVKKHCGLVIFLYA